MEMQRVLLVVAEHFKHDGLALDVLNEGLCDLNWNLLRQWEKKSINTNLLKYSLCVCVCVWERVHSRSGRGKSPEELLCQCSSEAQWKKPRHDDAGN